MAAGLLDRVWERISKWALNRMGFKSRYVTGLTGKLHLFEHTGKKPTTAPPIVLLHGICSGATPYGKLMLRLRRLNTQIIVPEVPGHGFSASPTVPLTPELMLDAMVDMLDKEIERPAVLFGNSMGGGIALHYAVERPHKVAGLILSSPAGAQMDESVYNGLLQLLNMHTVADAKEFVSRLFHRAPWWSRFIPRYTLLRFNRPPIRALLDGARRDLMLSPERLATLRMPILLLWGESERLLPAQNLAYFENNLPSHTVFERTQNVGHIPHLERPGPLAKRIETFISEQVTP